MQWSSYVCFQCRVTLFKKCENFIAANFHHPKNKIKPAVSVMANGFAQAGYAVAVFNYNLGGTVPVNYMNLFL